MQPREGDLDCETGLGQTPEGKRAQGRSKTTLIDIKDSERRNAE